MKYFLTKKNSYQIDNFFINEIGIESKILMENAAHSTFKKILQLSEIEYVRNVLIVDCFQTLVRRAQYFLNFFGVFWIF